MGARESREPTAEELGEAHGMTEDTSPPCY